MAWVGVLSLQGGFAAHARALGEIGLAAREVRDARELEEAGGLVLPGGESTAQLRLIERHGLAEGLEAFVASGRPVLATCAGLILAARQVGPGGGSAVRPGAGSESDRRPSQRSFGWLDVEVERNAYGRQLDSFEARSDEGLPLVFIRAPRITAVGSGASVLARWRGEPVLVRGGAVTGAAFHPELTPDRRVHRLAFAAIAESVTARPARSTGGSASAASGDVPGQDPGAGAVHRVHASERSPLHRWGA